MDKVRGFWKDVNDPRNVWRNVGLLIISTLLINRVDAFLVGLNVNWSSNWSVRVLAAILVVVLIGLWIRRVWRKPPLVFKEVERTPAKSALVVFVSASKGKTPAESAIEFQMKLHKLRHCSLLYTADSRSNALDILARYPTTTSFHIDALEIKDDRKPGDVYEKVKMAIEESRKYADSSEDILVDITGGTKLATFAMALAAQDSSVVMQYIYTPIDPETKLLDYKRSIPMVLEYVADEELATDGDEPDLAESKIESVATS